MAVRSRATRDLVGRDARRRLGFERLEDRRLLSLSHLYTFNDGLANDWIGSAHGSLFNGATIAGGQLVLANDGVTSGQSTLVQHARLPAGTLPSGGATVEVWFTTTDAANWARVFDVGNQSGTSGDSYLFFTPQSSFGDSRGVLRPSGGNERVASSVTTDDGAEHMAAIVVDTAAGLLRLYIDGSETGTSPLDGANAGSVNDSLAYLGRSLFNVDPGFTGSINELRIYDDARSAADIATDAANGPSTATKSPLVRQMEYLDRGMVAVRRSTNQAYIGWRLLGTDPGNIAFNLYRSAGGGAAVKLNASPLTTTTDFVDSTANLTLPNSYFVRPVIGGVEQDPSDSFTLAANSPVQQYLNVPLQIPPGGTTPTGENYTYSANDASVGDVDGDGRYEIILKWDPSNAKDNSQSGYTGNVFVDAYTLEGERLWRIDLGRNIRAGAHYTQIMVYDFDGDGKAEVALKTAPGTIDGQGNFVLLGREGPTADYRNSAGYILSGPEYLTIFNGQTGAAMATVPYEPARGSVTQWGDSYGNRVDRFTSGIAYLDGVHPSLIVGRGYYGPQSSGGQSRNEIAAYDFRDGQLTLRWIFKAGQNINGNINSNYIGQGAHSLTIGDVDGDGKDEIIYGAAAIDDNGLGLYSTGLGHGDALHLADMDPNRPGMEVFMPHEDTSIGNHVGASLRDARTGELLAGPTVTQFVNSSGNLEWPDVGRGIAMDIDPNFPGYEFWDSSHGSIFDVHGNVIYPRPTTTGAMHINFAVWWDADLLRETLDGTTISDWNYTTRGRVNLVSFGNSGINSTAGFSSNNGTKSTPALSADLFGDWREEVIWRRSDNSALGIFTTTIAATNRLYTLMHDTQYRESIAAQNSAYNQPPHPSFFLGAGMAPPPVPQIYTVQYSPGIPGDYNGDNVVDAADYSVWRNNLGSSVVLPNDTTPGIVSQEDYDVWRANYGASGLLGGGAAANALSVSKTQPTAAVSAISVSSTIGRDGAFAAFADSSTSPLHRDGRTRSLPILRPRNEVPSIRSQLLLLRSRAANAFEASNSVPSHSTTDVDLSRPTHRDWEAVVDRGLKELAWRDEPGHSL